MKIIISPAKTINDHNDFNYHLSSNPLYLDQAKKLYDYLKGLDRDMMKDIYKCSDKLIDKTIEDLRRYDLDKGHINALFAYDGIQYKAMAPSILDDDALIYLNDHLCILSGLYGLLRPFDLIVPYRLEMGFDLKGFKEPDLYKYWQVLNDYFKDEMIIDLASNEYSKVITKDKIKIDFINDDKVKATYAKKARGAFVRFLAINKITSISDMEKFNDLGYHLDKERSNDHRLVFNGG